MTQILDINKMFLLRKILENSICSLMEQSENVWKVLVIFPLSKRNLVEHGGTFQKSLIPPEHSGTFKINYSKMESAGS